MDDLANEQAVGSLCVYNQSFDYKYGLDNIWDYSANHCARSTLANIAFKDPSALNFVTYEQRREDVLLARAPGSNCDRECKTVYPAWPDASEYGESTWHTVHVASRLHTRMAAENPGLPDAPNVHLKMPEIFGADRCRCYSLRNVFILGVEATGIEFNHVYSAASYAKSGSSKEEGEHDPTSFLLVQGASEPFRVIPKGVTNSFTLQEALGEFGTCLDCQPDDSVPFWTNSICTDGVCEGAHQPKPTPRMSGMSLDVRTEYFDSRVVMPREPGYQWVADRYEPPYAIHVLRMNIDWTSRGSDLTVVRSDDERTVQNDIYRYGVLVRITPAAGKISRFAIGIVVDNMVNFMVLMELPAYVLTFMVFYACGRRSQVFRRGQTHWFGVDDIYRNYACQAAISDFAFQHLDDNNNGILNRQEVFEMFRGMVLPKLRARFPHKPQQWFNERIDSLMDVLITRSYDCQDPVLASDSDCKDSLPVKDLSEGGISQEEWIKNCTHSLAIDWDDLVEKIVDPDSDLDPISKICARLLRRPRDPAEIEARGREPIRAVRNGNAGGDGSGKPRPEPPTYAWTEADPTPRPPSAGIATLSSDGAIGGLSAAKDALGLAPSSPSVSPTELAERLEGSGEKDARRDALTSYSPVSA